MIREVREETGLDVDEPEHIDVVDNVVQDETGKVKYHFVIIDYLVKLKGGNARAASDAEELQWVALDRLAEYDLTKTFSAFFERNRQKLEKLNSCL